VQRIQYSSACNFVGGKKIIETDIEKNNQINKKKASIFSKLGSYYQNIQSKYELALNNSKKSLEILEKLFPGDHKDKATSYNNIASIYKAMGDLNKSLEYSIKALEIQERLFLGDHKDKATSYNNIGLIYKAMGDLNKSQEYYTKALEIQERLFPGDHPNKDNSYNNI